MTSITNFKQRAAALKVQKESRLRETSSAIREGRKLASLIKISQALAATDALDELAGMVAREICLQLMADQVFLLLRDARGELYIRSEYSRDGVINRQHISSSIAAKVIAGNAVLIPEALADPLFQAQESVVALNLRSVMACPLMPVGRSEVIGILYVCSYTSGELFGPAELELLKAIAAQVSIHLDRTRVLAEKNRLLREQTHVIESRGTVVEVVTHELGTPSQQIWLGLSAGKKMAEKIRDQVRDGQMPELEWVKELVEMLGKADAGVMALRTRVIDPLRQFQEVDLRIDRMALQSLSQNRWDLLAAKWRNMAIRHRIDIPDRLPVTLYCDPDLFECALTHLVDNAVKYSAPGSLIELEAFLDRDWLVLGVRDQGIGIPQDSLPFVCDWLYRGSNVANLNTYPPGLGMGLYIARRIIEAHGGELELASSLGKGTQVTVRWPAFVNRGR